MRSHYCGQVSEELIDQEITLCGWVNRRRDHGGVIFVDLRDREGLVQVVFDPDREDMFELAERIRNEYVLQVKGRVRARDEATINEKLATGRVEDVVTGLVEERVDQGAGLRGGDVGRGEAFLDVLRNQPLTIPALVHVLRQLQKIDFRSLDGALEHRGVHAALLQIGQRPGPGTALAPAAAYSIYLFGMPSVTVILACVLFSMVFEAGAQVLMRDPRLAEDAGEIRAAQALRYRVFYETMSARPSTEMAAARRDFDSFDDVVQHDRRS